MAVEERHETIDVRVVAAWPRRQVQVELTLPSGSRVSDAIDASGLRERFPELEIHPERITVFGERRRLDDALSDGDRVEICRPLVMDPREARRLLAEHSRRPPKA